MKIFYIALTAMLLTACSSVDKRYLDSSLGTSLEIPPDLSITDTESEFELPAVFYGDDESDRDSIPVLVRVDSIQMRGEGGLYWLEVDEPVDNLYQLVKRFWGSEGYPIVQDEPVIGMMQTGWIYKEEGTSKPASGWWENLFSTPDLSASQDQFKIRIERNLTGSGNRIYIAHRGTSYAHVLVTKQAENSATVGDDNDWQFRASEPELEIEMLSRLMIFLGMERVVAEQQVAAVKLFSPRAFMQIDIDENSPYLILKDSYDVAWNRVYHNLERLNLEIVASEFKSGFLSEGTITVRAKVDDQGDDGFLSLFSSSDDYKDRQFTLVVSEEDHEITRITIEDFNGDVDTSPEGAQLVNLLYRQVK